MRTPGPAGTRPDETPPIRPIRGPRAGAHTLSGVMARTKKLSIRTAARADLPDIRGIVDAQFGRRRLMGHPEDAARPDGFTLVAEHDGNVLGVCLASVFTPGAVGRLMRAGLPDVLHARRIGLLDTLAVHPDHTGQGLGSRLADAARDRFRARKVRVWASVAWHPAAATPDTPTLAPILDRAGMEPFAEVTDYWRTESLSHRFTCPACGEPPCECSAVMYAGAIA